jgi:hypothetical protein
VSQSTWEASVNGGGSGILAEKEKGNGEGEEKSGRGWEDAESRRQGNDGGTRGGKGVERFCSTVSFQSGVRSQTQHPHFLACVKR